MDRSTNIDLCRGLLFVLMVNTHAIAVSGLPASHWLLSDFWLPNGWATVIFVVLSGYSVGFICSARAPTEARRRALWRRGGQIVAVMLVSNAVFAALREIVAGQWALLVTPLWWAGFVTLDTRWTISGVLLPTAIVVVCGPPMFQLVRRAPWLMLLALLAARLGTADLAQALSGAVRTAWPARFFLFEGLGGFPVLPFVLNGCIGVWLGVMRNRSEALWRVLIGLLMLLQCVVFATSFYAPSHALTLFVATFGAIGKFAWMFALAHALKVVGPTLVALPAELIGKFALGSFVMHRFFLHVIDQLLPLIGMRAQPLELRYLVLLSGTLLLTWGLCVVRCWRGWIDAPFRRLAL